MKHLLKKKFPRSLRIIKIRGEASSRIFYRIFFENYSLMAMVYSLENDAEINRIVNLTTIYKNNGINVPAIIDIFENQIILQEDLGDLSLQKLFRILKVAEKKEILIKIARIVQKLNQINFLNNNQILNKKRLKWEMDFFIKNFALKFFYSPFSQKKLQKELYTIVDNINEITVFAHRDFHSRNMLYYKGNIYLVDFQDSLIGPFYYDLVSFAYDSYLDLRSQRENFFQMFNNLKFRMDYEQIYLTALQRNIKALGTFGYQVLEKKNLLYKKYINRTIRHILGNRKCESIFSYGMELLKSFYFNHN